MIDDNFLDFPFESQPENDFPLPPGDMDSFQLSSAAAAAAAVTSTVPMHAQQPPTPFGMNSTYALAPETLSSTSLLQQMGFEPPMTPFYSSSSPVNFDYTAMSNNFVPPRHAELDFSKPSQQGPSQNHHLQAPHQPQHQSPIHQVQPHQPPQLQIPPLQPHPRAFHSYLVPQPLSSSSLVDIADSLYRYPKEEPESVPAVVAGDYDANAYFQKLLAAMQRAKSLAQVQKSTRKRYRVLRGISAGGSSSKPPKQNQYSAAEFVPVRLHIDGADVPDVCYPMWGPGEVEDGRRIVRIERMQDGADLHVKFSIVGCANENPVPLPAGPDTDVIEVLCLQCEVMESGSEEETNPSDDNQLPLLSLSMYSNYGHNNGYEYYITSVEVVGIVEHLIGTQLAEPQERRKERGRIRSNLVPFWLKKPVSLRIQEGRSSSHTSNKDLRYELAKRIMSYEIRRPRGFDKEVRILRWDKLIPALKRALQSYYVELPTSEVAEPKIES